MSSRMEAASQGLTKYHGMKCRNCGTTEKWTLNATCVQCAGERSKQLMKNQREKIKQMIKQARMEGSGDEG